MTTPDTREFQSRARGQISARAIDRSILSVRQFLEEGLDEQLGH